MRVRRLLGAIGLVVAAGMFSPSACSGVVVLTNRAKDKVSFTVVQPDGRQSQQELLHDDVVSVPTAGSVTVAFQDGAEPRRYLLRANGIYYFHTDGKRLDLLQQPIPGLSPLPANSPAPKAVGRPAAIRYTPFPSSSWRTIRSRGSAGFGRRNTASGSPRPRRSSSVAAAYVSKWWPSRRGTPATTPTTFCG